MRKSLTVSKEINTFDKFKRQVTSPTEHYIIGIFNNQDDDLYKAFETFTNKYPEDFNFFQTFESAQFLESTKLKNLKVPSIVVYYHDFIVSSKESNFRVYDDVSDCFRKEKESFKNYIEIYLD